jgi:hypothetical protein
LPGCLRDRRGVGTLALKRRFGGLKAQRHQSDPAFEQLEEWLEDSGLTLAKKFRRRACCLLRNAPDHYKAVELSGRQARAGALYRV